MPREAGMASLLSRAGSILTACIESRTIWVNESCQMRRKDMPLPVRSSVWIFTLLGLAFSTVAMTARSQDSAAPAVAPARPDSKARELMEEMLAAQWALKSYSATLEVVDGDPRGVR